MALSPLGLALMMQPPGAQARPGQVGPTDVLGAYNLATNTAEQQYQAKLQQQNALWGGLAGIGTAGILASPKLFGTGGPLSSLFGSPSSPTNLGNAIFNNGTMTGISGVGPTAAGADSSLLAAAPSTWAAPSLDFGSAALAPYATGAAADAGAGSVASGIAADTALAGGADAAAGGGAAAAGMGLADLLPFLFG